MLPAANKDDNGISSNSLRLTMKWSRLLVSDQKSAEAFAYAERSKARALLDVLGSGRVELDKSLTADERKRDVELRKNITMLNRDLDFARQTAESGSRQCARIRPRKSKYSSMKPSKPISIQFIRNCA